MLVESVMPGDRFEGLGVGLVFPFGLYEYRWSVKSCRGEMEEGLSLMNSGVYGLLARNCWLSKGMVIDSGSMWFSMAVRIGWR